MATTTLNVSPSTAGAKSSWRVHYVPGSGYSYTTPNTDGTKVTISVPSSLSGVVFNSVTFTYSVSSDPGTRKVQYYGTATNVTNANLLEKLQAGETEIQIYFSFRAPGGGTTEGLHEHYCTWSDITVTVDYIPAGLITGTVTTTQGSSVTYILNNQSVAIGEQIPVQLIVRPDVAISGVTMKIGDSDHTSSDYTENYYEVNAPAGVNTSVVFNINIDDCQLTNNIEDGYFSFVLHTASSTETTQWVHSELHLVGQRIAPTITAVWSDSTSMKSTFGEFVQSASHITCTITVSVDTEADSTTYITARTLTINDNTYTSGNGTFEIGSLNISGSVPFTINATDNFGTVGSLIGSITLLAYAQPTLTAVSMERYDITQMVPDETSDRVVTSLTGSITSLASANAWTMTATYTNGVTSNTVTILSGNDGRTLSYTNSASLFQYTLANSYDWNVVITITDVISTVSYEIVVPKTGAIFNIEVNGVAVGMRSSSTAQTPKFETDYESHFYKPVYFHSSVEYQQATSQTATFNQEVVLNKEATFNDDISIEGEVNSTNGVVVNADVQFMGSITDASGNPIGGGGGSSDTGWTAITLVSSAQATGYVPCGVRKKDGIVYIRGCVNPTTSIPSSNTNTVILATLPDGFRPPYDMFASDAAIANSSKLLIYANGDIQLINRIGASLSTNERISLTASYPID